MAAVSANTNCMRCTRLVCLAPWHPHIAWRYERSKAGLLVKARRIMSTVHGPEAT